MQTEILEQIIHLPIAERIELIEKIYRSARDDLREDANKQPSTDERKAAYLRLRGALKMKNPPMSKQEVRDIYHEHLTEKHK